MSRKKGNQPNARNSELVSSHPSSFLDKNKMKLITFAPSSPPMWLPQLSGHFSENIFLKNSVHSLELPAQTVLISEFTLVFKRVTGSLGYKVS